MENQKEMKRNHYLIQVVLISLSLITSVVSAQIPCDTIPIENMSTSDETMGTNTSMIPQPFTPDNLIIPVQPYLPSPPLEPTYPLLPYVPSTEKTVIDPKNPEIPVVDNEYTLGSIAGSLTVNGLGAAEYMLPIEAPDGGPLMPSLSLVYNSQNATNGIAGYGISLSGLSAITRGEKRIIKYNDDLAGITYSETDNLFLDGKRLILISGYPCQEGALYCIEGDPYTKVTAHGQYTTGNVTTWFEIKTPDGLTYQYGNTTDSRLTFQNNSGNQRIASWHINRTEDIKGNYMTVSYLQDNYYPYPVRVSYGMNSVKSRGLLNSIVLTYEDIGATPSEFFFEDKKGSISKRIAMITTSSNDKVFRKYYLKYNVTSDKSQCRFARLTSIREENGNGDSLTPTKLTWKPLTDGSTILSKINDPTLKIDSSISLFESSKCYMAADVTGDGISDIIVLATGTQNFNRHTFVIISRSVVEEQKLVKYADPIIYALPYTIDPNDKDFKPELKSIIGGVHLSDIDGDGFNDMILPKRLFLGDAWNSEQLYVIYGKSIAAGKVEYGGVGIQINTTSSPPLYTSCDFDKDGTDEILCMETTSVDGLYQVSSIKINGPKDPEVTRRCNLEIPGKPEKIFCGDYNNDGLTDIIVLHKDGYKIFYNCGCKKNEIYFNSSMSKAGTTIKDRFRIDQGDFNGDGLLDFVYNVDGESNIWVAYNKGNGTFNNVSSFDLGLSPKLENEPDGYFLLRAVDMNRDGRSDVVVCKAAYELKSKKLVFKETQIRWIKSNGTKLMLKESFNKTRKADADEKLIFLGDFDGDGYIDLANLGSALDRQDASVTENTLNIYRTAGADASTGRVIGITDGLGNTSNIAYSYLTSPDVYSSENKMENYIGVNTMTLPLPVVKQLNISNGICRSNLINYKYKDLYVEMTRAGVLGFGSVTKTMANTGESSTDTILGWNVEKWIPNKIMTINTVGGNKSSIVTEYMIQNVGNTYFSYERFSKVTDMYNETVTTSNTYDLTKGVLLSQTVLNNGNKMYKTVDYSDYKEISGVWLPGVITLSQKHEHDSNEYSSATKYTYDDNGNIISTTVHSGTDLALTTNATYDVYGNCTSSFNSGKSVVKITKHSEYDATGRYVIKSWQEPEAAVMTFTYDLWGNLLTENDCTDSSNILTTTHTYDNWGRRSSTTLPDERKVKYSIGWGKTDEKHHYSLVEETGKPWILTWYDKAGNETLNKTFGAKNVLIQKVTEYDSNGKVRKITEQTGKLKTWKSFCYDELGRIQIEKSSLGNEVNYKYGNRSVTSTTNGRQFIKSTDAWGNILSSTDPLGATVTYKYRSNGQPSSITTNGATVNITYDCAGNRISVSDPDAGLSTYAYAADGTLLKHTDARGVTTINQYDNLGRLSSIKIGNNIIKNYYGTSGYGKLRLTRREFRGNLINYTYDNYGRVISEVRYNEGIGAINTEYRYDSFNRLSSVRYNDRIGVFNKYDDYGFKTAVSFKNKDIYRLESYDGLTMRTSFADSIVLIRTIDSKGLERKRQLSFGSKVLDYYSVEFDTLTLNLRSRERMGYERDLFRYDNLDRLVAVNMGTGGIMNIRYAVNGNIISKSGLGTYNYGISKKPHAVTSVENSASIIPSYELITTFNSFGMIDRIEDNDENRTMEFSYGADLQRYRSVYYEDGKVVRSVAYLNHMEIINEEDPVRIYYLDDNVIFVDSGSNAGLHYLFKDHLGSILSAFDENGSKTFEATYDAWGKQEVKRNLISLRRGYTGHEMLNEFGIINMNGRLYDPELGRFFSPDPYVQFPDFTQSFNRYSYCLNNPLKYTDPSGQFLTGTALLVASTLFHIGSAMLHAKATGGNVIKSGLVSLLTSPLCSFGIGKLYGSCGSIGKELLRAGTHGLASGLASAMDGGNFGRFASGFISGGASAMVMSGAMKGLTPDDLTDYQKADLAFKAALVGGGASLITGGNFLKGALIGYNIAMFNYLEGEIPDDYVDELGNVYKELPDLFVYPSMSNEFLDFKGNFNLWSAVASNANSSVESFGKSLTKYGANSTLGNNGKLYWKTSAQRPFYGNQYVSTQRLTTIGGKIVGKATPVGYAIGGAQVAIGFSQDITNLNYYGQTDWYNTVRASASFGGAMAGMEAGIYIGAYIGSCFGGFGAIPGSIIGATIYGIIGAYWGGEAGGQVVDNLYGY